MRQVSIRQFQVQAGTELKKGLPFALTNHGKVVAYIVDQNPEKEQKVIHETIHNVENPLRELTEAVNSLKLQKYPQRKSLSLSLCNIHHVYTKTCGCYWKGVKQ